MPKRATFIKRPEIVLDATLQVPLYKQLYERLRREILEGQLERGARLPSTRTLASELGVSRTTTALAYKQLLLEGYLESRAGNGGGTRFACVALGCPDRQAPGGTNRRSCAVTHPPGFTRPPPQGTAVS